jgi:hypothetical protein
MLSLSALILSAFMSRHILLVSAYSVEETFDVYNVKDIFDHFEEVVKELRDEIEAVYLDRCTKSTLDECGGKNYNELSSRFRNPTCFNNIKTSECGCGGECV